MTGHDTKRDPCHWEQLVDLPAAELKMALDECAKNHIGWAIDQARILYYRTQPGSDCAQVITAFALENVEQAAAVDVDTALQAWQLAAKEEGADAEKSASAYGKLLREVSRTDMHRAWDIASLALATSENNNPVHREIVSFLVEYGNDPDGVLLKTLSRDFVSMADPDLEKIVARAERLAATEPYRAVHTLREIVEANTLRPMASVSKALTLLKRLQDDPRFTVELLEREHGMTSLSRSLPADKAPCNYHPAPAVLQ